MKQSADEFDIEKHPRRLAWATVLRPDALIALGLAATVLAVYAQVNQFDFIAADDDIYIGKNPFVTAGLSSVSMLWALKSVVSGHWHPLTMLSHMLDVQLFGLDSGAHHLVNVAIHALTTVLVFAFLRRATGSRWPSAFCAFLFGLHPLHVESVAWICERKDVLSGFF